MKIYSGPLSMFGAKAEIAAREKGLDFELVMVPFDTRYEPKHPEVLRINPKGQVPVLVDGDVEIFDSTQIFEYLEDTAPPPSLWPKDTARRARARLLELQSDEVFFPPVIRLMSLQQALDQPDAKTAIAAATAFYSRMEARLGGEYLMGQFSYVDVAFYMAQFFAARMGAPMGNGTPRLQAWRTRMRTRPAVAAVIGPMIEFLKRQNRPPPATAAG